MKTDEISLEQLESRCLMSIQTFTPPTASSGLTSETLGKDGSLYFVESDQQQIGRVLPNKQIVEYTVPDSFGDIGTLVTAKDGSIWFSTSNGDSPLLGHLSTKGKISSIAISTDATTLGFGSDGTLWFGDVTGNLGHVGSRGAVTYVPDSETRYITKIIANPSGGIFYSAVNNSHNYSVHWAEASSGHNFDRLEYSGITAFDFNNSTTLQGANNLTLGPDGNLRFYDGIFIVSEDPKAGTIASRVNPDTAVGISQISSLTTGPDGNLWFVNPQTAGKVWTLSTYGEIFSYDLPNSATASPFAIVNGKGNTLWVTDEGNGDLVQIDLNVSRSNNLTGTPVYHSKVGALTYANVNLNLLSANDQNTYQFQRANTINGPYTTIGTATPGPYFGGRLWTDSNVTIGATYYYRVRLANTNTVVGGPIQVYVFVSGPFG